jgi:predicted molibdopterin-dependent oxidoreductase YjgC
MDVVKTVCSYCGVGCELNILVNRKTGKIANVKTDYASKTSLNEGRTCVKGRFAWQFVHSDESSRNP